MVFVSSPRTRRSVRAGLIAICVIAVGLLTASPAVSDSPVASPGGSVSSPTEGSTVLVSSSGTYTIPVQWSASCPDTSGTQLQFWFWYVHIYVTHQDGSEANFQSIAYVGTEDSGTNNTQGMVVQMAPGLSTETFEVRVSLLCGGQEQVIGSPSITLTKCDPNAYNRAQREYDMAEHLAALGEKELAEAEESDADLSDETANEGVRAAGEAAVLKQVLHALEHAGRVTPTVAAAIEIAHVVNDLATLAEKIELNSQDWSRLTRGAQSDFELAKLFTDRANADLAQALASKGCLDPIEGQLNKLLADQKRLDDARDLIDSWQNNGYLYVSPVTHTLVDEATALKQAERGMGVCRPVRGVAPERPARASIAASAADLGIEHHAWASGRQAGVTPGSRVTCATAWSGRTRRGTGSGPRAPLSLAQRSR